MVTPGTSSSLFQWRFAGQEGSSCRGFSGTLSGTGWRGRLSCPSTLRHLQLPLMVLPRRELSPGLQEVRWAHRGWESPGKPARDRRTVSKHVFRERLLRARAWERPLGQTGWTEILAWLPLSYWTVGSHFLSLLVCKVGEQWYLPLGTW